MASTSNHYLLILCGGTGPRLWPLSRASNPKQFLSVIGQDSLLQQTVDRALHIVPSENIFIISNQKYLDQIQQQIKNLIPKDNIIAEPEKKNTLMAITYATAIISKRNPDAIISSTPSDHYIIPVSKFTKDMRRSAKLASQLNSMVLIGIEPTSPNPSYGYLQVEKTKDKYLKVTKFIEKPNPKKADLLIKSKALWNSGIYTFSVATLCQELQKHQPDTYKIYNKLSQSLHDPAIVNKMYHLAENQAIDTAISEKSKNLITIKASFKWSDVGEWKAIFSQLKKDKNNNTSIDTTSKFISLSSQNCLIKTTPNKLIGLVGVSNLAIIDTPDGLLVCDLNSSSQVRDLVSQIVSDKQTQEYFLS